MTGRSPRLQDKQTQLAVYEALPTTEADFLTIIREADDALKTKEASVQEARKAYDAAKAAAKEERQRRDRLKEGLKELQKQLQQVRCSQKEQSVESKPWA